jgi:hypothetical protein
VARLLGMQNLNPGELTAPDRLVAGGIELGVGPLGLPPGTDVLWSIRAERVRLASDGPYRATVLDAIDLGTTTELLLRIGDDLELRARPGAGVDAEPGQHHHIDLPADEIHVWRSVPALGPSDEGVRPHSGAAPARQS